LEGDPQFLVDAYEDNFLIDFPLSLKLHNIAYIK